MVSGVGKRGYELSKLLAISLLKCTRGEETTNSKIDEVIDKT